MIKNKEQHKREVRVKKKLWSFGFKVTHESIKPEYLRTKGFDLLVEDRYKVIVTHNLLPTERLKIGKHRVLAMVTGKKIVFFSGQTGKASDSPYDIFGRSSRRG
jgi:hypothetical protein|tara:strand:- start:7530 stop:7841 length:312 start_codon:yes stop_codon:yes gene_type:complete